MIIVVSHVFPEPRCAKQQQENSRPISGFGGSFNGSNKSGDFILKIPLFSIIKADVSKHLSRGEYFLEEEGGIFTLA